MTVDVKAGDRVRLTFTEYGAEHVVTGIAEGSDGFDPVYLGGWSIAHVIKHCNGTVELLAPAWHDALVVQAGGRTFAKAGLGGNYPWAATMGGYFRAHDEVAALGPVRVVVGADGEVVV